MPKTALLRMTTDHQIGVVPGSLVLCFLEVVFPVARPLGYWGALGWEGLCACGFGTLALGAMQSCGSAHAGRVSRVLTPELVEWEIVKPLHPPISRHFSRYYTLVVHWMFQFGSTLAMPAISWDTLKSVLYFGLSEPFPEVLEISCAASALARRAQRSQVEELVGWVSACQLSLSKKGAPVGASIDISKW